jgi:hypothetical protein
VVVLLIFTLNLAANRSPELGLAPTCVKKILGINRYASCQFRICNDRSRIITAMYCIQEAYEEYRLFYRILVAVRPLSLKLQRRQGAYRYIGCAMGEHLGTGFLVSLASSKQTPTFINPQCLNYFLRFKERTPFKLSLKKTHVTKSIPFEW